MIDSILSRLEGVRKTGAGKWLARCPAHNDRSPSLSVRQTDDGRILVHDFAGCSVDDVLTAVGLGIKDLFPPRDPPPKGYRPRLGIPEHRARDLINLAAREATICALVVTDVIEGCGTNVADCMRARRAVEVIDGIRQEVNHGRHR